ncbi:2OG-Fe(II) oxygenase family protein, partial [Rhizobium ruizarguesonis]
QVCPGKDAALKELTDVPPRKGYITCNIGDMLMRWSDDQLQSTLHRVRMPRENEYMVRRRVMRLGEEILGKAHLQRKAG